MQVGRHQGRERLRQRGTFVGGQNSQSFDQRPRQPDACAHRHPDSRGRRRARGQGHRVGPSGQLLQPVGAVARELRRGPVGCLLLQQRKARGRRPRRVVRHRRARLQRRIDLRQAARGDQHAGAVVDQVVIALVPNGALAGEPEQSQGKQRLAAQRVDGLREVARHPGQRRRFGIGLPGEIEVGQRPVEVGQHPLQRPLGRVLERKAIEVALGDQPAAGCLERFRLDRPPDIQIFGEAVRRALGAEPLCEPDSELCGRKRVELRPARAGLIHGAGARSRAEPSGSSAFPPTLSTSRNTRILIGRDTGTYVHCA